MPDFKSNDDTTIELQTGQEQSDSVVASSSSSEVDLGAAVGTVEISAAESRGVTSDKISNDEKDASTSQDDSQSDKRVETEDTKAETGEKPADAHSSPNETSAPVNKQDSSSVEPTDKTDADYVAQQTDATPDESSWVDVESRMLGGAQIIFPDDESLQQTMMGWTNLRWMATGGTRRIRQCSQVAQLKIKKKNSKASSSSSSASTTTGRIFAAAFSTTNSLLTMNASGENYERRIVAIFEEPCLILILRRPTDVNEVRRLLDIPLEDDIGDAKTVVQSHLVVETVIDPETCKLRLSRLTCVTSIENGDAVTEGVDQPPRRRTCFQLLTPGDTITLSAIPLSSNNNKQISLMNNVAFLETKKLEVQIAKMICQAHEPSTSDSLSGKDEISWRHQLVLGTLHSFVISGSLTLLQQALSAATVPGKGVPSRLLDAVDESGRSPLHYACMRRASGSVNLLVGAGADCSLPVEDGGLEVFPVHISAKLLDERSLSVILASPNRPDPNSRDKRGWTPMYTAILEGEEAPQYSQGSEDGKSMAIGRCLSALKAWGGEFLLPRSDLKHPLEVAAMEWRFESLDPLMDHVPFRFPLPSAGTNSTKNGESSLGALYNYPLHTALVALRSIVMSPKVKHFNETKKTELSMTVKGLLSYGFEPNERIEVSSQGLAIVRYFGFSPLQMLAMTAVDFQMICGKEDCDIDYATKQIVQSAIVAVADILVRNGSRLNLDAPPKTRCNRIRNDDGGAQALDETFDIKRLRLDANGDVVELLGGKARLENARKTWLDSKVVKSIGRANILDGKSVPSPANSLAAGGSDDKSCAICWREFGLMTRKHRCRITNRFVFDECSSKRITVDGVEHRLSDGQFLLARADVSREVAAKIAEQEQKREERRKQMEESKARIAAKESEEVSNREGLFSGIMERATNFVLGEEDDDLGRGSDMGGLQSTLSQTRDALNERGNKLNDLSEKTAQLVDSSASFAKMAKELERSQRGWFG